MKKQIDKYLYEACSRGLDLGVFSAVAAAVSQRHKGKWHRHSCYAGMTRLDQAGVSVGPETLFDLASLTKPLCTTLSVLPLLTSGRLQWEDSIARHLPAVDCTEKGDIRLWHILNHCSGLPSYQPYYKECTANWSRKKQDWLIQRILAEPLVSEPGKECRYSDLGFILLAAIIEEGSGQSLESFYQKGITGPLGLERDIGFLALDRPLPIERERIAATEDCSWRGRIMQGEVHDEHCWLVGGVAGHAGLFATLNGVTTLCELITDVWKGRIVHPNISSSLLKYILEYKHQRSTWALGFDRPTPGGSSSGSYFSPTSVGHLGFSGTSFWIDAERDILIVLLTNRVHPTRANENIRQFRPYFHDQIMQVILKVRNGMTKI